MSAASAIARPRRADNSRRGVVLALLAVLAFTVMDSLLKWLAAEFPVMQVFLFRWLFALLPIAALVRREGGWPALRTTRLAAHLWRSALSSLALVCYIYAFSHMQLADVVAISFAAPLIVTALSAPLLGERVDGRRWLAVLTGFAGVLVIVRPGSGLFGISAAVAMAGTVIYAGGLILVRRLGATESTASMSFYLAVSSIAVALCAIPFGWVWPHGWQWALLAALGLIGGVANMLVTAAYRCAPVATVAPLDYGMLVGTTAIGYFVFGELPDLLVFAGAGIVIATGLYIIYADTRRAPGRVTAAPPAGS